MTQLKIPIWSSSVQRMAGTGRVVDVLPGEKGLIQRGELEVTVIELISPLGVGSPPLAPASARSPATRDSTRAPTLGLLWG